MQGSEWPDPGVLVAGALRYSRVVGSASRWAVEPGLSTAARSPSGPLFRPGLLDLAFAAAVALGLWLSPQAGVGDDSIAVPPTRFRTVGVGVGDTVGKFFSIGWLRSGGSMTSVVA